MMYGMSENFVISEDPTEKINEARSAGYLIWQERKRPGICGQE